jgi:hypothetical protein
MPGLIWAFTPGPACTATVGIAAVAVLLAGAPLEATAQDRRSGLEEERRQLRERGTTQEPEESQSAPARATAQVVEISVSQQEVFAAAQDGRSLEQALHAAVFEKIGGGTAVVFFTDHGVAQAMAPSLAGAPAGTRMFSLDTRELGGFGANQIHVYSGSPVPQTFALAEGSRVVGHLKDAAPAPAGASPAGASGGAAAEDRRPAENPHVQVRTIALQQERVDALQRELSPPQEQERGGLLAGARRAAQSTLGVGSGSPDAAGPRQQAAESLLAQEAAQLARTSAVVVVIGGSNDLEKVRDSLARVGEPVVVLHADPDREANASLRAGGEGLVGAIAGRATGAAQNVWIYRAGEESPTKIPVATVTDVTWGAFFQIDVL